MKMGTELVYKKKMEPSEMQGFFATEQGWDLLPRINPDLDLTVREGKWFHRPVAVEGIDGVVYAGVAETAYHFRKRDNHYLMMRFVLGTSQADSSGLDKKMEELGFHDDSTVPIE